MHEASFEQASHSVLQSTIAGLPDLPEVLYQYTDVQGLEGIFSNRSLWATHYAYLNDKAEVLYTARLAAEMLGVLGGAVGEMPSEPGLDPRRTLGLFLDALRDRLVPFASPYVACFSDQGDLLSQWRAYGRNGLGFAVGIDPKAILDPNRPPNGDAPFLFRKVVYDRAEQEQVIRELFDTLSALLLRKTRGLDEQSEAFHRTLNEAVSAVQVGLGVLSPFYKHPAFSEEREWRLVHDGPPKHLTGEDGDEIVDHESYDVRIVGDRLVPYRTLSIGTATSHPFKEIVVGPRHDFESTRNALRLALLKWKVKDPIQITPSTAPYRG